MAKKRKHSAPVKTGPREVDPRDNKITIRTFEDVADSEDEFHMQRDKVALDEGPESKRRRRVQEEDAFLEQSDEEIMGYDDSSEEEDLTTKRSMRGKNVSDSEPEAGDEEDEENAGDWGASRKEYYDADNIETEADALEEEAEAKRLQQKKLQKMSEADFGFDEDEWLDTKEGEDDEVVTEVIKDIEITPDMSSTERLRLLQTRYPEFEFLANDFVKLQPLLSTLRAESAHKDADKISNLKARALSAYIASLLMYFAVLTSTSQDSEQAVAIDPTELREHEVMQSLLECRKLWLSVQDMRTIATDVDVSVVSDDVHADDEDTAITDVKLSKKQRKQLAKESAIEEVAQARRDRIAAAENDIADLSNLIPKAGKKESKSATRKAIVEDDDSDFGEEESLSARAMEEKAQKKKSLRFYTSQIAQKSNRRADAGRDAGGDADLPYRERLRDRQARLNAEAENRGKALDKYGRGTALGGSDDEDGEEAKKAETVRDDEDEYYDMIASKTSKKKADKAELAAVTAQAKAEGGLVRVVEGEVDEDGKRAIGYVIEKNKGLAPKRNKLNKNPRLKKRVKYEKSLKKLASQRATYKGGEARGGYSGELTGIKTGLVKSTKL